MFNFFKSKATSNKNQLINYKKISKENFNFLSKTIENYNNIEVLQYYKQDPLSMIDYEAIKKLQKTTNCVNIKIDYNRLKEKYNATIYRFKINSKYFDIVKQSGEYCVFEVENSMIVRPICEYIVNGNHSGNIVFLDNSLTERIFFNLIEDKWLSSKLPAYFEKPDFKIINNTLINEKNNQIIAFYDA